MTSERSLFDAYREWRRLAKACQKAISRRNWAFLSECQNAIKKLQPSITAITQQVRDQWKRSQVDHTAKENQLRTTILELMALLESNKKLLQAARAVAISKREELEITGRRLKRIQGSYSLAQPSAWTSLS
ncbi:MAG TPA: hypothetical protein VH280_05910 [Verrucomicrobiae bacterium]|jgi:hypothetical protein|nr:hypothetical protein [Verrucomicrobiae bacterium]